MGRFLHRYSWIYISNNSWGYGYKVACIDLYMCTLEYIIKLPVAGARLAAGLLTQYSNRNYTGDNKNERTSERNPDKKA